MSSDRQEFANQMLRLSRSESMDGQYKGQFPPPPKPPHGNYGMPLPPQPPPHYQQQLPAGSHYDKPRPPNTSRPNIKTVVTNSWEDGGDLRYSSRYARRLPTMQSREEDRQPPQQDLRGSQIDDRDMQTHDGFGMTMRGDPHGETRAPPPLPPKPVPVPLSPDGVARPHPNLGPPDSSNNASVTPDGMKRSFWHHARQGPPGGGYPGPSTMHPDFVPPTSKRPKFTPTKPKQEVVITPRSHGAPEGYGGRPQQSQSWAEDDYHQRRAQQPPWHLRQAPSFGSFRRDQSLSMDELGPQRTWSGEEPFRPANRPSAFRALPNRFPSQYPHQGSFPPPLGSHSWQGGSFDWSQQLSFDQGRQYRDDIESRDPMRSRTFSRDASWDVREVDSHRVHFDPRAQMYRSPPLMHDPYRLKTQSMSSEYSIDDSTKPMDHGPLLLLAQPEDRISLSETLCVIRENIEVFSATKADVDAPAPGRKHPVVVGQVGLRCIHCRHTTKSSERVKRAVCYPSSIKRIYRTVIDMKLDHFQHCRFVPAQLKDRLEELKTTNTRSTGTTMQYFIKAATKMGMVDDPVSGVRLKEKESVKKDEGATRPQQKSPGAESSTSRGSPKTDPKSLKRTDSDASESGGSMSIQSSPSTGSATSIHEDVEGYEGKVILALPEDKMSLSPLRCFLREQCFAFSATEEDIAVRTPTTFSVTVGQVGIGCIHCHALPAKDRSNRAVCFPFSIGRVYQSVADIQRFHLGECKMVPPNVRAKFEELQSASSKGSKGLATRQYWISSAKKIGLVDTPKGIRFARDPSVPSTPAVSLDILAQVASNVTTVNRPLVLPEDKPCIAEFLYVVMEQLQACRFTEADRNKRRLKDVGCIGVECRHCAGQVESRKFFWSSVNAVESNFVSVHTHMMECKQVPAELKTRLSELKGLRKEQTARLKTGSQKAFFQRVWTRLHTEEKTSEDATSESSKTGNTKSVEDVKFDMDKMNVAQI
uniref:Uncharacterized protein n=1 Tax=Grammatophora oceanica TaxID=210454 RepID=A0A7S1UQ83_9STRA|mmetsp:Transcript_16958/g.25155  ORF Transcript_16958/g.25155 Transcript_16958/m.25155 type:complete len:983 (+) Transcript_16958:86-3034(+)|eukprot:CAMPEP_0194046416 /NCGR_PEP_ID=MMETSP0009_2-20130614/21090_1 /TAXON_ID=210454 /ORGANISM="Grammatophora oceanica, Strain CCMP 410" /LENGTH=982 /DNA_ID=CAMNT_0038691693 /DNA_START=83 /DNA_END=3031 /DNA_ORIENTATION=-